VKRLAIVLLAPMASALAQPVPEDTAQFRAQYQQQYQRVEALRPDMLVEELRLRIELVASRGSQVGGASNERRVRGFESALLQSLREVLCTSDGGRTSTQSSPAAPVPAAPVVGSVTTAAAAQRLRTQGADVAEISALTQRLIDSQGERFCALRSLDDVQ
jgi:hypothetical protein